MVILNKDMFIVMKYLYSLVLVALAGMVFFISSCRKNFPDDRDSIDPLATFTRTVYDPTLGRNTVFSNNFNAANSSQPLEFTMLNLRRYNDEPAPELTDSIYPVSVWKNGGTYTGKETSLEEIESKRSTENHRIFEIRKNSGQMVLWSGMDQSRIRSQPDSGYKFDVKVSNSGGVNYYYNLRFMPKKAIPYEPSNYNPETGMTTGPAVSYPTNGISLSNMQRLQDGLAMQPAEVDVYFTKKGTGNSLTFKFLDSVFAPINPRLFNTTDWPNLVHGFNMNLTDTAVTYQVGYPIPLGPVPTRYTNAAATRAVVAFSYYRIGTAGFGNICTLSFNYAIYEKGDWEIAFQFKNSSPKFEND